MSSGSSLSEHQWKKLGNYTLPNIPGVIVPQTAAEAPAVEPQSDHQAGYEDGYSAGEAAALAQQQGLLAELAQIVEEVKRLRERCITEGMQDMAVALHTLFKVLFQHELQTDAALLQALSDELQGVLLAEASPKLFLSTLDYQVLKPRLSAELQAQVTADDGLPQGVVRATAGKSMLELDIVTNLEQVLANAVTAVEPTSLLQDSAAVPPSMGETGSSIDTTDAEVPDQ